jgi:hypothetical protein
MNEHDKDPCTPDDGAAKGGPAERISSSKRTLLKAGWVVPVIAAVSLPASGMVHSSCNVHDDGC